MLVRVLSSLKQRVLSGRSAPRRIVTGPFGGISMNLSLAHQLQIYLGLFERETYPWLERLSKGISTGIDIGAADGEYTLYFLKRTPAAKVFAFEPDLSKLPCLESNLLLNGESNSKRLTVCTKFIGSRSSNDTVRLDFFFRELEFPCLIKVDVDGAEADILAGAARIKSMRGTRWLIETHSQDLERACVDSLRRADFETKIIPNAWWRWLIPEQRPIPHNRWLAAWKS